MCFYVKQYRKYTVYLCQFPSIVRLLPLYGKATNIVRKYYFLLYLYRGGDIVKKLNSNICMKCLKNTDNIISIRIPELGKGGHFEGFGSELRLCPNCHSKLDLNDWKLEVYEGHNELTGEWEYEEYIGEYKMIQYIKSMPEKGQDMFYNEFAFGYNVSPTE